MSVVPELRGDVYNTLANLLGLPMTLTDIWQVAPAFMMDAAPKMGVRLEKIAGGHYRFAFLDRVVEDFRQRVPNATRDARQGSDWSWDRFFQWISTRVEQNHLLVESWVAAGLLKPVPPSLPLRAVRPAGMDDQTWKPLEQYLTYDGWREPWYADTAPVCRISARARSTSSDDEETLKICMEAR